MLWHIERGFLDPGAERIEPNESLLLMRASGERAEAEQVGSRGRPLADGAKPEEIAIVLRSPASSGRCGWRP